MVAEAAIADPRDTRIKFDTYRNYLECLCEFLRQEYRTIQNFVQVAATHSQRLQGIGDFDANRVEPQLRIAWNTEYLLRMDLGDIDLIRINNQWAPIQCYYAVYSAAEAFSYVLDGMPAAGHRTTLDKITNYFVKCGLPPWNFAYRGYLGKNRDSHMPVNFPAGLVVLHHLRRRNSEPHQIIAACLRAEHRHRVDDLWQRSRMQCHKYEYDPGVTGLLHFLYRLRLKSNYREIDAFVVSADDSSIRGFADSMHRICTWSLAYFEVLIGRKCKKRYLVDLMSHYLDINPNDEALRDRMGMHQSLL